MVIFSYWLVGKFQRLPPGLQDGPQRLKHVSSTWSAPGWFAGSGSADVARLQHCPFTYV